MAAHSSPRSETHDTQPNVGTATIDEDRAIALLTLAFAIDPANRWAWPDAHQYLTIFPSFARALSGAAFEHCTADATGDYVVGLLR